MIVRALGLLVVAAIAAAPLAAGDRLVHRHRQLVEYASVCEDYLITGECVNRSGYPDGMEVEGEYRPFKNAQGKPCAWTPRLAAIAEDAVGCLKDARDTGDIVGKACRFMKLTGAKGIALCTAVCTALKTIDDFYDTQDDCNDDGILNGSTGSSSSSSSSSGTCFPGAARVHTRTRGLQPLSAVAPGEEILAVTPGGTTEYSKVRLRGCESSAPLPAAATAHLVAAGCCMPTCCCTALPADVPADGARTQPPGSICAHRNRVGPQHHRHPQPLPLLAARCRGSSPPVPSLLAVQAAH